MTSLKLPFEYTNIDDENNMLQYIKQSTYLFRAMFKHLNKGENVDANTFNHYNHIELLDFHMRESILYDAKSIIDKSDLNKSVCFGGKKNFHQRQKGIIDKEDYKFNRLHPFCIIGEKKSGTKAVYSNRRFKILKDLSGITFRDNNKHLIKMLFPKNIKKNYREILQKLYNHQVQGDIPITYRVSADKHISISYDETLLFDVPDREYIKDLIFSIDMNPNYIGWSIVQWYSSSEYEIVKSGVVILKELNDYENQLIKEHYHSDSIERKWINNKRSSSMYDISIMLVNKAIENQCEYFSIEDLKIKSKDIKKGKYLNRLCIQQWNRKDFINSLQKHCNLNNIKLHKSPCGYTSFYGNLLFRKHNLPDMVLASVEIGRRCFEFNHQYIVKDVNQRKNIIHPDFNDFKDDFLYALNDLDIKLECCLKTYKNIYKHIKDKKIKYRKDIDKFKDYERKNMKFIEFIKIIEF